MNKLWNFLTALFILIYFTGHVFAQDQQEESEVFDLGDVLIMEKGDEINTITSTNTVSSYDIEVQGFHTTAEVLESVPGIDVQTGGKGQATLKLRGFDQRDVKVLIDGVPAHESYFGSLDLDQIPADSIAKIKIIKGASSVLYGPNTMGGVINIITKKGGEKPHTSFTTSFGQNNTQNYIFNHGATRDKVNYWVTASHRTTDGFDLSGDFDPNNPRTGIGTEFNEDGGIRDLSHFTKNTLNAKIGYEHDDNSKIYLAFDYHENEKGCPTEFFRYWEFVDWSQWHMSLAGEHDLTDIVSMKARLYYVDHTDSLEDVSWDADHTTRRKWFEKSSYDDFTLGGELQTYLDFGDISLVKMGVSYMKDNHKQKDFYDADTMWATTLGWQPEEEYETDIYSFGIEDEIRLLKKLTFSAGISYDVQDPVEAFGGTDREKTSTWNPQAGLSYDIAEDFNLYASIGKKTRFPQMQELYSNLAGGNADLEAQQTIAYEIGASKRFTNSLDFSIAAFFNDIEKRIIRERIAGQWQYMNKGESEIKGIEAQLDYTTPWNLELGLGYAYTSAQDQDDSASPAMDSEYIPEHKLTFDAVYMFDFGLTASFQAAYTGEQIEYDDNGDAVALSDFWLCNARLSQAVSFSEKISADFFIEAKNIFDKDYEEGNGPNPGRSLLAGMKISF